MKNIHLIPTDKPSRLYYNNNDLELQFCELCKETTSLKENRNIYITSAEEITDGDWVLSKLNEVILFGINYNKNLYKKIILTTDKELIEDGVQAIDDEFLEWFVKNPSCEEVDIMTDSYTMQQIYQLKLRPDIFKYKIIIPKEEQKQHLIDMMKADEELGLYEEPKQETLEEVAKTKYPHQALVKVEITDKIREAFVKGAKWQQEQFKNESTAHYIDRHIVEAMVEVAKQKMYSEEETEELITEAIKRTAQYCNINKLYGDTIEQFSKEWFNENKKK